MKIFRKIRYDLLEKKTGKYFKYAIGEIVLVVIGILIALQINNWNQNEKIKNQLDNIYITIDEDLKIDLVNLNTAINYFERLELKLDIAINTKYPISFADSINETNFEDCVPCENLIISYVPFETQKKGFELLKKYNGNKSIPNYKLSQEIIQLHTTEKPRLSRVLDIVSSEAYNNLKYFEQFPWYSDYLSNKYNSEAVIFFTQNQNYKNKATTFKLLAIGNYLNYLQQYQKEALVIIDKIEKRHAKK